MGNEVSAGEGEPEDGASSGEESEQKEASGGLWALSQELEDGEDVSVFTCTASSQSQADLCRAGAEVGRGQDRQLRDITEFLLPSLLLFPTHSLTHSLPHSLRSIFGSCGIQTFSSS